MNKKIAINIKTPQNQVFLIKSGLKYLKKKKSIYLFLTLMIIASISSFIPMFLIGKSGNYSWIPLATQTTCLSLIILYLFNILFIDSKYNQLDLLLLSKAKKTDDLFVSKWITAIIFSNIFIILNSISSSSIFSWHASNITMLVPLLLISIILQNLFAFLLILIFSIILLLIKGRVLPLGISFLIVLSITSLGVGIKIIDDNKTNRISFKYNPKFIHGYANLYTEESGKIVKTIVEKENFINGTKNNPSLNQKLFNLDNVNPINWINNFEEIIISKQSSSQEVITHQTFNVNQNHFKLISNFWKNKPTLNIKGLYPINVKPTFEMNHLEIEEIFLNLYNEFKKQGYSDINFQMTKTFIETNNLWQNAPVDFKDALFKSIGVTGKQELLYLLRDKELIGKEVPNLFEWMEHSTSKPFSDMIKGIYTNKDALFNIKNIDIKNRNEIILNKVIDQDFKPNKEDVDYFKEIIKFSSSGKNIELNKNKKYPIKDLKKWFPKETIKNEKDWMNFIDKNSFYLKELTTEVKDKLEKLEPQLSKYKFKENKLQTGQLHYQYKNSTQTSSMIASLSLVMTLSLIMTLAALNFMKLKKVNLKGF